jgi:hypothetical protein
VADLYSPSAEAMVGVKASEPSTHIAAREWSAASALAGARGTNVAYIFPFTAIPWRRFGATPGPWSTR